MISYMTLLVWVDQSEIASPPDSRFAFWLFSLRIQRAASRQTHQETYMQLLYSTLNDTCKPANERNKHETEKRAELSNGRTAAGGFLFVVVTNSVFFSLASIIVACTSAKRQDAAKEHDTDVFEAVPVAHGQPSRSRCAERI